LLTTDRFRPILLKNSMLKRPFSASVFQVEFLSGCLAMLR